MKKTLGADAAADATAGSIASESAIARHTEGPWRVRTEIGTFGDVVGPNDVAIAQAQLIEGDQLVKGQPIRQANAHLIAAAPELLEALKHAVGVIRAHVDINALGLRNDGQGQWWPLREEYLHHMDAAIAKAEGRS